MSYVDYAKKIVTRLGTLGDEEIARALRAIERGLHRRTSKVRSAARRSMVGDAADATRANVTKELALLRARKGFDEAATAVGRAILQELHVLMEGRWLPYGSMKRLCGRFNSLNGSLMLASDGTRAVEFVEAVRRFRRDAHHIIKGSLAEHERVKSLLAEMKKYLPEHWNDFDLSDAAKMPTVALTTDVHLAKQSRLVAGGKYRTLDIEDFSKQLDKLVDVAIPAKGKVSLEKIIRAHHDFYMKALPDYGNAKAAANEGYRFMFEPMEELLEAARKVDQAAGG